MVVRLNSPLSLVGVKLTTSEWERRTKRMQAHALDEGQSAIGEVYESAPRPRWTADPPVTPGLYFCKLLGGSTRVVDVYAADRGRLQASWSDIEEFPVSRPGMLWSDHAIQEPE